MEKFYLPTCDKQKGKVVFKVLMFIFWICFSLYASATTYYFANEGDDSRTPNQASRPGTPWKSIAKLNAIFPSLKPGDSILFKRGDRFFGAIKITSSGNNRDPIVISAYGNGPKPLISGNVSLTEWDALGNGLYAARHPQLGSEINMVTVNGKPREVGRYPNTNEGDNGYLRHEAVTATYVEDKELSGAPDFTGGEVVIRTNRWILDREKIVDQKGSRLYYVGRTTGKPKAGFGYFIQNHIKALDRFGEWAYNKDKKRFVIFFGQRKPSDVNVKVSVLDNLIYLFNQNNIVVDGLAFDGANQNAIFFLATKKSKILNCDIRNSGVQGILASNAHELHIDGCNIFNSTTIGIFFRTNSNHSRISNNVIRNTGIWHGMAQNGSNTAIGIRVNGDHNIVEYNTVDSTGYSGIRFTGDYTVVKNNLIRYFGFIKDDAGGIYSGSTFDKVGVGRKLLNNIITDGIGAKEGTNTTTVQQVSGIYLDNNAAGVDLIGNTIARCGKMGIYVHNAFNIKMFNNTCFDNKSQVMLNHDDFVMRKVRNVDMRNNIFVAKESDQMVAHFYTKTNDIDEFGTINNNHYLRPLDEEKNFRVITRLYTPAQHIRFTQLDQWKSMFGHDGQSKKSQKTFSATVNPDSLFRFVYNASRNDVEVSLPGIYVDARNKRYEGKIKLEPYTSAVLIKAGKLDVPKPSDFSIAITYPAKNATYKAPSDVRLKAEAAIEKGTVRRVEFYWGNKLVDVEVKAPFEYVWKSVKPGKYQITAKAYDQQGNSVVSQAVNFVVEANENNRGPATDIITPANNVVFESPASVRVRATAKDPDGSISRVEFYSVDNRLLDVEYHAPYDMRWSNRQSGTFKVFAKAYDNDGAVAYSKTITFRVKGGEMMNAVTARSAFSDSLVLDEAQSLSISGASLENSELQVYPNPATSTMFVRFTKDLKGTVLVTIRNAAGSIVRSSNTTLEGSGVRLDVSGLLPGNYIVTIAQGTFNVSRKFQKQ